MQSRYTFATGLDDAAENWGGAGVYQAMLLTSSWLPDPSVDVFVSDISANELVDASYSRELLTGMARVVVLPASADAAGFVQLQCDDFTFGVLAGAEIAGWLAVFADIGPDATSPLLCAFVSYFQPNGVASCDYTVPSSGLVRLATTCSQDVFIGS